MKRKDYELLIFFLVTFGLNIAFGIYFYFNKGYVNDNFFIALVTIFPGIGVATAKMITKKSINLPYKIFTIHFAMLLFYIIYIYLITNNIIDEKFGGEIILIAILFGSVLLFLVDKYKLFYNNLEFNNMKLSIRYIIFFVILIFISYIIRFHNINTLKLIIKNTSFLPVILSPVIIFLTYINFFSEELGWRYFLQNKFQEKFGNKIGILLLGFVWGIFYIIPLFILNNNDFILYIILERIISCIFLSIYFSYTYIKTNNIWIVAFIHGLYSHINGNISSYNLVSNTKSDLIFLTISMIIVFLPFLFTNAFNKQNKYMEE